MLAPLTALAEWHYSPSEGHEFSARLDAGVAGVSTPNANLGLGRRNPRTGQFEGDPKWGEAFIKPTLAGSLPHGWYGEISAVGAITFGDGDPSGFTSPGDGEFALETGLIGWRSATAAEDQDRLVIDLSVGRQTFDVGDGFLIDDGNFDFGNNGGVWLVPRQAFQRTIIARLDYRAWHSDVFFLEADPDNDKPDLVGTNIEYQFEKTGHVGVLLFQIFDAAQPHLFLPRQGMNVVSVRVNDWRVPFLSQLAVYSEFTRETGDGRDSKFDASAWYGELIYHFDDLPWKPWLSYRYAYFSGDSDNTDGVRRDFDGLFYGFDKRGWGTWFQGEVIGGYLLFNNNQRNHLVHLVATPRDDLTIGIIGGVFDLAESNYLGIPVTSRHFGDEINIHADWVANDHITVSAAYGVMFPGRGAIQAFGDDKQFQVIEVGVYFAF